MKGMKKTKNTGVYQYVSEERRHDGRPDVCFYFNYKEKDTGKKKWVKVGWRSEKVTAQYAAEKRGDFLTHLRNGETPKQAQTNKSITYAEVVPIVQTGFSGFLACLSPYQAAFRRFCS